VGAASRECLNDSDPDHCASVFRAALET
jgi:hypothetical protein